MDYDYFFKNHCLKPYHFLEHLTGQGPLSVYFQKIVENSSNLITKSDNGKIVAIGSWEDSPWDTSNILYKTAHINFIHGKGPENIQAYREVYQNMEKDFSSKGYEYVCFRVNSSNLPAIQIIQENGFELLDGLLILSWEEKQLTDPSFKTRFALKTDLPVLQEIARTSFTFDRFHTDSTIPNTLANELHANWIQGSFTNNPNERVLVSERNDKIIGFLSYRIFSELKPASNIQIMTIILLATHSSFRGIGVATSLIKKALDIANQESFIKVIVKTQQRNIQATKLYENLGFRLVDTEYTLRKLLSIYRVF